MVGRERLDAAVNAPHRHDRAEADRGNNLSRERHRHGFGCGSAGQAPQEDVSDDQERGERAVEPARQHQHRMPFRGAERGAFAGRDPEAVDRDLAHAPQRRDARVAAPRAGAADGDDDIGLLVGKRAFERAHEDHVGAKRRDPARDRQRDGIAAGHCHDTHARLAHTHARDPARPAARPRRLRARLRPRAGAHGRAPHRRRRRARRHPPSRLHAPRRR